MQLRFSQRWLLILTALVAAGCYWWVAPPMGNAQRFVHAVNRQDWAAVGDLLPPSDHDRVRTEIGRRLTDGWNLRAFLYPRTWYDVRHRRSCVDLVLKSGKQDMTARVIVNASGIDGPQFFTLLKFMAREHPAITEDYDS